MEPYLSNLLGAVQAILSPAVVFAMLILFALVAGGAYLLGIWHKERAATQRAEQSEAEQSKRTLMECNTRLLERAIERGVLLFLESAGGAQGESTSRLLLGPLPTALVASGRDRARVPDELLRGSEFPPAHPNGGAATMVAAPPGALNRSLKSPEFLSLRARARSLLER